MKQEGQHIGATCKSILKVLLKQYRSATDFNQFESATIISRGPFSSNHAPWPLPLTLWQPLSIVHILDSWGVSVWSFMIIALITSSVVILETIRKITMRHDLDLWPFDLKINRANIWLMLSKCTKLHDHRMITELVIVRKPFSNNHAPWPWPLTFWPQNQ